MQRLVAALALFGAFSFVGPGDLLAAQKPPAGAPTIQVTPAILDTGVRPGSTTNASVTLTNPGTVALNIVPNVTGLDASEVDGGFRRRLDVSSWIHLPPPFALSPGASVTVPIGVTPPARAEPGGHYATLVFEAQPQEAQPADAQSLGRVGVICLFTVPGDLDKRVVVSRVDAGGALQTHGPESLSVGVRNAGNVHFLPDVKIKVTDGNGEIIDELTADPGLLLPRATRTFSVKWGKGWDTGRYSAVATVRYGSDASEVQDSEASRFWVIPPLLLYGGAAISLAVLGGILVWLRRRRRRAAGLASLGVAPVSGILPDEDEESVPESPTQQDEQ